MFGRILRLHGLSLSAPLGRSSGETLYDRRVDTLTFKRLQNGFDRWFRMLGSHAPP